MSVSETEMREFFQKVVDQVATLSSQASRVEGLEQRVNELADRLRGLEEENNSLRNQISDANNTVARMENEINTTRQSLDNERAVTQSLRDTIVQRDAGVVQLESSFRQEQDAHKITTSERDDARQKIQELEQALEASRQSYDTVFHDRDQWRTKSYEYERENVELKQRIDKIQSVLNPLRVISSDVA